MQINCNVEKKSCKCGVLRWPHLRNQNLIAAIVERSNIADGGDFKALLLHHCTKFNSSTNAQLWHVCPTIGNILLAAVKFKVCSTY